MMTDILLANLSLILPSPLGNLGIVIEDSHITRLQFLASNTPLKPAQEAKAQHIAHALEQYFANPSYRFDLPLKYHGSPMQLKTWQALLNIPVGQTRTYGDLAKTLQTSPRAIGQACRTNPLPIFIPCHRIVAATHVGGFAGQRQGDMLRIKNWLLAHERAFAKATAP